MRERQTARDPRSTPPARGSERATAGNISRYPFDVPASLAIGRWVQKLLGRRQLRSLRRAARSSNLTLTECFHDRRRVGDIHSVSVSEPQTLAGERSNPPFRNLVPRRSGFSLYLQIPNPVANATHHYAIPRD